MNTPSFVLADRNSSRQTNQTLSSDDDDDAASLHLLVFDDDDDDQLSLSTFDSAEHQHQSYSNSLGNILNSSRHSLGTTIGTIKKKVQSISKKAPKVGNRQKNYCELDEMPSAEFESRASLLVTDCLNPESGHTGTSTSDVTNEHSFAGYEEDSYDEFEAQRGSPKRHESPVKHSRSPLRKKKATSPSTNSSRLRAVQRRKSVGFSASQSLPRNRKIRSTHNSSQSVSQQKQQQQGERNQCSHNARSSARKPRHVDVKRVLEKCSHSALSERFVTIKTKPHTTHSHLLNTAPRSPPKRGVHRTSLNEYIGRISPHKPVTQSPRRERVNFDFDPKNVKAMMVEKDDCFKNNPDSPRIAKPMVNPFVVEMERLSIHHR